MSKISSGRPLFPLSVDIVANSGPALNSKSDQAKCVLIIFPLQFLYPWTQLNSTNQSRKSHLAVKGGL